MNDYHIIYLQETWLNYKNTTAFKNSCILRNDRPSPRNGGGTMILCKKGLNPLLFITHVICLAGFDLTRIFIAINKQDTERIADAFSYKISKY